MKKKTIYAIRLAVGLAVVALAALACQSVLDFDSLKAKTPGSEAGVHEAGTDVVIPPDKPPVFPDTGKCVNGAPCPIAGGKGVCAFGTSQCYEAGAGVCKPTAPGTETCDGKDSNCNGVADANDPTACTGENYCKTAPTCSFGCAGNANCSSGNTCDTAAHTCKCGGAGNNPRCSGGYTCDTTSKTCKCGTKKLVCGANENCDAAAAAGGGACVCGAAKSETGKACAEPQVCLGASPNKACGIKSDAGPDKGPPADKGPDKPPSIDKSIVDQPPVQVDKAVIDQAPVIDKTPLDQTKVDLP